MKKERITVLDIPFDAVNEYEALETIINHLKKTDDKRLFIATPNPEMLLEAGKNPKFKEILNNTGLNIPDGIGILWASTYLNSIKKNTSRFKKITKGVLSLLSILFCPSKIKQILPQRVTGTDMMQKICKNISDETRVFLLGGAEGIADKTKKILETKYNVRVVGTSDAKADQRSDVLLRSQINDSKADLLFVAFGAPKQEFWINRNLNKLESVKVAIGVGGAFDFICGKTKRAPSFMRKLGLEWLYRLIRQPARIVRIFNAVVRFPVDVIKSSFFSP